MEHTLLVVRVGPTANNIQTGDALYVTVKRGHTYYVLFFI